jgi:hypothetical protein
MNVNDLQRALDEENFPPGAYSLDGQHLDGAYVLRKTVGRWTIDYTERSCTNFVAEFASETDACEFFLKKMREDIPSRNAFSGRVSTCRLDYSAASKELAEAQRSTKNVEALSAVQIHSRADARELDGPVKQGHDMFNYGE